MIFTIDFVIPPARLTFELAQQMTDTCGLYDANVTFNGFTGKGTIIVESPAHYEMLNMLEDAAAILTGITDGHRSFRDFFGKNAPLDHDHAQVYTSMCLEGKIW